MTMQLSPIGYVRADAAGFRLVIDEQYRPALQGLDGFSHLVVVWWCHAFDNADSRSITQSEQPYKTGPATLGIFATRSPIRPNPIAITPVPILAIDEQQGIISVPFMDAEDGTPIIDLKPYHPSVDRIRDVHVPAWCSHWPQWYEDSAEFDWAAEFVNAS